MYWGYSLYVTVAEKRKRAGKKPVEKKPARTGVTKKSAKKPAKTRVTKKTAKKAVKKKTR